MLTLGAITKVHEAGSVFTLVFPEPSTVPGTEEVLRKYPQYQQFP